MTPSTQSSSPPEAPRPCSTPSPRAGRRPRRGPVPPAGPSSGRRWPRWRRSDPRCLQAWADLAELADDPVERYAYARVGYHRGLDALRAAGWRGSGYVRWRHESNRGFLRSLDALRQAAAAAIGETDEEQRCELFLRQLDPEWGSSRG